MKTLSLAENINYQASTSEGNEAGTWSAADTATDSVGIEITPLARSAVEVPVSVPSQLTVTHATNVSLDIALAPETWSSSIEVFDMMGRTLMTLPLEHDRHIKFSSPLPPGSYFARVDRQVAKFMVVE